MIARKVLLAAVVVFALAFVGSGLAATHRTSHHAKTQHTARLMATGSTTGCPNMGGSSSSPSSASTAA